MLLISKGAQRLFGQFKDKIAKDFALFLLYYFFSKDAGRLLEEVNDKNEKDLNEI